MFRNLKKFFLFPLYVFVLASCLTAPAKEPSPQIAQPEEGVAAMRPRAVLRDELTVVLSVNNIELDFRKSYLASEAQFFTGIYEGLFSYHPLTLEPVMAAAESYELSEDKKQWTFTLRGNARFSNGDKLTAENFRAAWISSLEPEREAAYSSLFDIIEGARDFRNGLEKDINKIGITAPDEKTLVVRLNSPASFFPAMLCHHSFSPIHSSMLNDQEWIQPVTNGPFRIASIDKEKIILEKDENYWDNKNVYLNKITVKNAETGDDAAALWNSGEARWLSGNVNVDALTDFSGIQVNVMFATHYYFIRSGKKPWNDYRLRRAMTLVLPWDEIRAGRYLPAETLIFPISGYPEVKGITEADYEEAEKLMKEAGFSGGEGVPEIVIRITPSKDDENIASLMAAAWKEKLRLNVRVEVVPYEQYFQSMKEGGYVIGSSTWIGDFADPYTFLQMWRRDSNLNDGRFNDSDYEALIEKSMIEEGSVRLETLAEAEKLLLDRGAVLPISYSYALNIIDTNELEGWFPNALNIHPFKYLSFKSLRSLPGVAFNK